VFFLHFQWFLILIIGYLNDLYFLNLIILLLFHCLLLNFGSLLLNVLLLLVVILLPVLHNLPHDSILEHEPGFLNLVDINLHIELGALATPPDLLLPINLILHPRGIDAPILLFSPQQSEPSVDGLLHLDIAFDLQVVFGAGRVELFQDAQARLPHRGHCVDLLPVFALFREFGVDQLALAVGAHDRDYLAWVDGMQAVRHKLG
jgi:hypothetical protein